MLKPTEHEGVGMPSQWYIKVQIGLVKVEIVVDKVVTTKGLCSI